jgi:hypothetical protein
MEICLVVFGSTFDVRSSVAMSAAVAPPKSTHQPAFLRFIRKGLVQIFFWSYQILGTIPFSFGVKPPVSAE